MLQADVLGQVIIGAEPQTGNHVQVRIPRGQENNRQAFRQAAQFPAQFKPAFDFIAQTMTMYSFSYVSGSQDCFAGGGPGGFESSTTGLDRKRST